MLSELISAKVQNGSRFEREDLEALTTDERNEALHEVTDWLDSYTGDFEFLVSVKVSWKRNGYLSFGQVKGVLNCMLADAKRNKVERVKGYFTFQFADGTHRTLRFTQRGEWTNIAYLAGPVNTSDYVRFAYITPDGKFGVKSGFAYDSEIASAARFLLEDAGVRQDCGIEYARESGNCYVCGKLLTTPESIEAGIGPVCAGRM